ncbi:MAG: hypothetical protein V3V62_13935 [bacterium]
MSRRGRSAAGRLLALLLLLALSWAAGGCGVKGDPKAPEMPVIRGL